MKKKSNQVSAASSNPLSKTHEFMPACPACFPREGTLALQLCFKCSARCSYSNYSVVSHHTHPTAFQPVMIHHAGSLIPFNLPSFKHILKVVCEDKGMCEALKMSRIVQSVKINPDYVGENLKIPLYSIVFICSPSLILTFYQLNIFRF